MRTLATLPLQQIHQQINFGEREFAIHENNLLKLKAVKLKNKIMELIELYYGYSNEISESLKTGALSIEEFQLELIRMIRELYTFIIIETKAPVSLFVEEMKYQIPFVLKFGLDIDKERIGLDDRLNYRASLYIYSAWVFYQNIERYWERAMNKTEEKIVCDGGDCGTETDWQPIGTTKRINEENIGKKCWCEYRFR